MAFTLEERQILGLQGLLPARVKSQEEQLELCKMTLERYPDDLTKYIYLMGLLVSKNYTLFAIFIIRCLKFPLKKFHNILNY